jgi:transposase
MHIDCVSNSGKPYLRVAESYSMVIDGKRKNRKRTVRNIGPLSRFDDGRPDFLDRLRQSFKEGRPIISGLDDLIAQDAPDRRITAIFDRDDNTHAFSDPKNIGYFLLDSLYDGLGIYDVLNLHKSRSDITIDLNGLGKLLVFGRILNPDSKSATWNSRGDYVFSVTTSKKHNEIYDVLDTLDKKSEAIQMRMNHKIAGSIGRDSDICFYDVTNYWFEIDDNDEDLVDENGATIREGLRKRGPSKAKNRKPITQMGLFIDSNGIPIGYKLFPGNHIDQTTLRPAMRKTLGRMNFGRIIVVADGGLNSGKNLAHVISAGNGYVVSKSARGSDKSTKKWILDQEGYICSKDGTFKSKSKIRERTIEDENGDKIKIKEKLISYWSRRQYLHALHENKAFIDYLNAVTEFPDKLKDKQSKLQKYLKKEQVDKETGEMVDTVTSLSLDMDRIQMDMDLMGYYTVMTSELDMNDRDVIDKYHGLSRIEESFRTIKTDFEGRPVYVWTPEHINGHFLTCFLALTMIRIIQHKILKHLGKETKCIRNWELGLSADRIKTALAEFKADAIPCGYYRLTKPSEDRKLIMDAIGIDADLRIPSEQELRQLKYKFDKAKIM